MPGLQEVSLDVLFSMRWLTLLIVPQKQARFEDGCGNPRHLIAAVACLLCYLCLNNKLFNHISYNHTRPRIPFSPPGTSKPTPICVLGLCWVCMEVCSPRTLNLHKSPYWSFTIRNTVAIYEAKEMQFVTAHRWKIWADMDMATCGIDRADQY